MAGYAEAKDWFTTYAEQCRGSQNDNIERLKNNKLLVYEEIKGVD